MANDKIAELQRKINALESKIQSMVPREDYDAAVFAAAQATTELDALVSLLRHIDEEARNGWTHVHSNGGD